MGIRGEEGPILTQFKGNPPLQAWFESCLGWEGLEVHPHRFGGAELRWGRVEIGHAHSQGFIDLPFPRTVRDSLIEGGYARPHHVLPDSGWVTCQVRDELEAATAGSVTRLSYLQKVIRRETSPTLELELAELLGSLGLM